MNIEISQIFTQIVAFLIMLWIMKKFAWKPFLDILETRHKRIRSEFEEIASKKQEVAKLFADYDTKQKRIDADAKIKIQEAMQLGSERAKEIEQNAQEKALHILNSAKEKALGEKIKMEGEIKEHIITISAKMAEAIIKEKMDKKMQDKVLDDFAEKVKF